MKMRLRIRAIAAVSATLLTSRACRAFADGRASRFSDMNAYNGAPMLDHGIHENARRRRSETIRCDGPGEGCWPAIRRPPSSPTQTQYGKDDVASFPEAQQLRGRGCDQDRRR